VRSINLGKVQVKLFDTLSLISDTQVHISDDLHKFGLLSPLNYKKHDSKKVFYYYILKAICDCVIESKDKDKYVFFYNGECLRDYYFEFLQHSNIEELTVFLDSVIKKMNTILPTLFYICSDQCFCDINENIYSGEWQESINRIIAARQEKADKKFTFEKAKKFVDKYELTYLNREYFNKLKIGALLYK
tara:strand:+ start:1059 stop:1625 length:567 start_codon:yes stop_codon:yes gene_type:complete